MTVYTAILSQPDAAIRLPDPPEHGPSAMTTSRQLSTNGNAHALIVHLGNRDTTIVDSEHYLQAQPGDEPATRRIPDLIVAFDADPELYFQQNSYIISEQGKPPDFVLEIGSVTTRQQDRNEKRRIYAHWGVREYWRFDNTVQNPAHQLAGDRLVHGQYQPIAIQRLGPDRMQGFSPALNLYLRWDQGNLLWIDPNTSEPIDNLYSARTGRQRAEDRADTAEHRADTADAARSDAEHRAANAEHRAADAEHRATDAEHRAADAEHRATDAEAQTQQAAAYAQTLEQELQALRAMIGQEQADQAT